MSGSSRNLLMPPDMVADTRDNMLSPSWADAWQYNAQAAQDWVNQQRAISAQRGLWNDQTGLPTRAGVMDAAQRTGNALLMGTTAPGIRAFHGSPHSFDRFDTANIGTGEGAQAYGRGLYFAENEGVARGYQDRLAPLGANSAQSLVDAQGVAARLLQGSSPEQAITELTRRANAPHLNDLPTEQAAAFRQKMQSAIDWIKNPSGQGHMYEVNINANPEHFLDWDKPLSEQSQHVQEALAKLSWAEPYLKTNLTGGQIVPSTAEGAQQLAAVGIPGIRYLDQGSRATGEGTSNHVVFDANTIDILRKYGLAGLMAGGGAAASGNRDQ